MELNEVIYHRRAVRSYTDQSVDKSTAMTLIQAAIQAPSAINLQPWAFAVIQDKSLLNRYSDRAKVLASAATGLTTAHPELKDHLSDPAFNIFYNASTLIVICAKPAGQHPAWDCCLAAQNLMLAAHSLGLGTCPIGLSWTLLEQADVKQELRIPVDYVAVVPIIVGYPLTHTAAPERREPEILCWK